MLVIPTFVCVFLTVTFDLCSGRGGGGHMREYYLRLFPHKWGDVDVCEDDVRDRCIKECETEHFESEGTTACYDAHHVATWQFFHKCTADHDVQINYDTLCWDIGLRDNSVYYTPKANTKNGQALLRGLNCVSNCVTHNNHCWTACTVTPTAREKAVTSDCYDEGVNKGRREFLVCLEQARYAEQRKNKFLAAKAKAKAHH